MSEVESERRSSSPTDFHKYRPSVQDNPYPQEEPPATSSVEANSTTATTPPTVSQDQDPHSQAASSSKDDSSMDFHYPHGPRRATWAGEATLFGPSHFRPEFTQPPAFSHLDAAEALSHLPLATKFAEADGSSIYSLASASSMPILTKRPSSLSLTTSTPGATTSSQSPPPESPTSAYRYESFSQVPRLPPILQVERTRVTTTATQAASAQRRRNDATFKCPVPGTLCAPSRWAFLGSPLTCQICSHRLRKYVYKTFQPARYVSFSVSSPLAVSARLLTNHETIAGY